MAPCRIASLSWLLPCVACLVAPPYLSPRGGLVGRRHWPQKAAFGSEIDSSTDVLHEGCYRVETPETMIPLSRPPLLLLRSSSPILSREGCSLLCRHFDSLKADGTDNDVQSLNEDELLLAENLLSDVHDVIDTVTNCPRHDGEMLKPRYVRYVPTAVDESVFNDQKRLTDALLPDGLHVDTNNGKLFRHVTAILYLTDNQDGYLERSGMDNSVFMAGGGTTFPLANPSESNYVQYSAQRLLDCGIHHTKRVDRNEASFGRALERASLGVFNRDNGLKNHGCGGVRVMPEAGKLIFFHNVDDDGMSDCTSFHGGEELMSVISSPQQPDCHLESSGGTLLTKSILVFFKEIPLEAFRERGRVGFAEQCAKSRHRTQAMYY